MAGALAVVDTRQVPDTWRDWSPAAKARLLERLRYDWSLFARPDQLTPPGDWTTWLVLAGRGWGKTRVGAEDAKDYATDNPGVRIAVVAPTFGAARDTCVEGESGLLAVIPPRMVLTWNRSIGELLLVNGSRFKLFSGEEPDRLRGPQHHRAWCDELAAWRYPEAWDQLMFGLRLGTNPQAVITTTPRPTALVKDLLGRKDGTVQVTKGSTYDNARNLAPAALAELNRRYEGTRLGRQELHAELLDDNPDALVNRDLIDATRVRPDQVPELVRVVVGVDPAVTSGEDSDETGIVVKGIDPTGHSYVLADYSGRYSPDDWARRVLHAVDEHGAGEVAAEANNGGDLVVSNLRAVNRRARVVKVHAQKSKVARAEPMCGRYERREVHHVGTLPQLEDQLCDWAPGQPSPDRLDAATWADELLFGIPKRQLRYRGAA